MAHYVIVGGGRVGTRLAAALDAAGHGVALVDRDPRTVEGLAPGFSGELVAGVGSTAPRCSPRASTARRAWRP